MITMRPSGFGTFGASPLFSFLVLALVIGIIIGSFVQSEKKRRKNNASPRITGSATVVAKRTHVWGDHSHTDYYATFQFESGDRQELEVPHNRFGYLVEGDKGELTFQGTRFVSFERI